MASGDTQVPVLSPAQSHSQLQIAQNPIPHSVPLSFQSPTTVQVSPVLCAALDTQDGGKNSSKNLKNNILNKRKKPRNAVQQPPNKKRILPIVMNVKTTSTGSLELSDPTGAVGAVGVKVVGSENVEEGAVALLAQLATEGMRQ